MNIMKFKQLWDEGHPGQQMVEFFQYMRFLFNHFDMNRIIAPVVVEIGIRRNRQKKFYRQLLLANHIGVDISDKRGKPDILGDSHDSGTFKKLQDKLNVVSSSGKADVIFIDGDHSYNGVKHDFFKYVPLVKEGGIMAIHDIHCLRKDVEVGQFWMKLREMAIVLKKDETFIEFFRPEPPDHYGIGLVIRGHGETILGVNDI